MNKPDLQLTREQADEIVAHCRAWYPKEACGILGMKDGEIVKVFRMTNAADSPVRYALVAQEQHLAYKKIEDEGWELGGIFHSHTRTEAFPSPTDVREAYEPVPYVIVSLAEEPPSIRAFRIEKAGLADAHAEIEEMPVVIVG